METTSSVAVKRYLPRNSYFFTTDYHPVGEFVGLLKNSMRIGGGVIFHQFDDVEHVKDNDFEILILGHCYNPFSGEIGRKVASQLLYYWSGEDKHEFYDYLDEISGRFFIILVEGDRELNVWGDACGTLPICYHVNTEGLYLASHTYLIKEVAGCRGDAFTESLMKKKFYNLGIRHCPADLTEVEGVKMLTPNLQLSYQNGKTEISRIFPRFPREEIHTNQIVKEVSQALESSIQCLLSYGKPLLCALSGGVDSRISLAATKSVRKDVEFFTFAGEGNASRDLECTRLLGEKLSLNFSAITLPRVSHNPAFFDVYQKLQGDTRWPNSEETLQRLSYFGVANAFEIRSSVSEVARSFMKRKFHINKLASTPANMVPLYKRVPFSKKWHGLLETFFSDWSEISKFDEVERLGYEWLDFYYWEYRVGTWQSLVLQDADYYTNPTVIFNNRKILSMMLDAPESFRMNDEIQKMIIDELDYSVMQVPLVKNFGKKAILREAAEFFYLKAYCKLFS